MVQLDKKTNELMRDAEGQLLLKTAHSLNPVPVYIYDPTGTAQANVAALDTPGISSLAATSITMLGFEPPEGYTPSLVNVAKHATFTWNNGVLCYDLGNETCHYFDIIAYACMGSGCCGCSVRRRNDSGGVALSFL